MSEIRAGVLPRLTASATERADLTSYAERRSALIDVTRLPLGDVPADDLRARWRRGETARRAWVEGGRS